MRARSMSFALIIALAAALTYQSIVAVNAAPQPPSTPGGGAATNHPATTSPTTACGPLSFTQTNYPITSYPGAVKAGDFNGDGKPDLAYVAYSGVVEVLLNNDNGGFGAPTDFAIIGSPVNLALADLNGDGHLDIVVADPRADYPRANFVVVLLGRGDGSFQAPVYHTTGYYPNWVGIGDFNGDGMLDIVTTNNGDSTVSLLIGHGDGSFGTATNIVVGLYQAALSGGAIGDFNGDGLTDLLIADQSSNSLDLMLNNGEDTFRITYFAADRGVDSVLAADLNHDGKLDTISNSLYDPRFTVMLGDGAGSLGLPTYNDHPIRDYTLGDLNNDGNLDLVTDDYQSNRISVLLGDGTGGFAAPTVFDIGTPPAGIAIADFNGDGRPDLAATTGSGSLAVLLNTCGEVTGTPPTSVPTSTPYPTTVPPPSPTPCALRFTDITGNIFYTAIQYLYCGRAINGYGTEYRPAQVADRAQFAKLLVLGLGLYYNDGPSFFSDVPITNYAHEYIFSAYAAGLVNGYDAATCAANDVAYPCYLPQSPMRRGQMTKMVVRASYLPLITPPQPVFSDVPPGSTFYTYVETAYLNGLISGYPDGTFRPNQTIRRDEMAQIIYAAAQRVQRYPARPTSSSVHNKYQHP